METPVSSCGDAPTLYELHGNLRSLTSLDDRQKIIGVMFEHDHFKKIVHKVAGEVLGELILHTDLLKDLLQEINLRLERKLLVDGFLYRDEGPASFNNWFLLVAQSEARRGWRQNQPLWLKKCVLVSSERLEAMVAAPADADELGTLLIAIERMENPQTKPIMREWLMGSTFADISRRHAIAVSTVSRRWDQGVVELRKNWPDG
jgi:DNA-directed RNA polymerase specialized sigma24 family protein